MSECIMYETKGIKLKKVFLPIELMKELLDVEYGYIRIAPYDKGFIQYVGDKSYHDRFWGMADGSCPVDYFIKDICVKYIKKYKKFNIKTNKNNWNLILKTTLSIYNENKKVIMS